MNIVLGITGGIAAYKAVEVARLLVKSNHQVKVMVTEKAKLFIHPNTFYAISSYPVYDQCCEKESNPMAHIELAKWADLIVILPATANTIAKLAHGICDDLLTTVCLATESQIYIAPAMNQVMWHKLITQENLKKLIHQGYNIIEPQSGEQACGDVGVGRMAEPEIIVEKLLHNHQKTNSLPDLSGKQFVITAGPTHEAIDPVRFISNHSSGKMGYAIANVLIKAKAQVILISGPVNIQKPNVHSFISVKTATEMHDAVFKHIEHADFFIGAAAVSDYRVKQVSQQKIKKNKENNSLTLELIKNEDILASVANLDQKIRPIVIGFAAETEKVIAHAEEKLINKHLDMIIANEVKPTGEPFHSDYNQLTAITSKKEVYQFDADTKEKLAHKIILLISSLYFKTDSDDKNAKEHQECLDLL